MAEPAKDSDTQDPEQEHPPRPEQTASTQRTLGDLEYTATAGTLNLVDDKDQETASVFYVAYTADGVDDPSQRPVTFCFNGGPGSSAVWLHLGAFGPLRVDVPDLDTPAPPPYRLVDNPHGLLAFSDLVFIDPVGTGFSRPLGQAKTEDFHSVEGDIASVGAFIRRWIGRNDRWNSPKYLAGESYGTTRAAGLAQHLQQKGLVLNGLVLISVALDFQTFVFETGNDLPHVLYLPSYAATAWYHDRLDDRPEDLDAFLDEVRDFALEVYAPALLKGSRLDPARKQALAEQLAAYTGLPAADLADRDLRIADMWFAKALFEDHGVTVGRLDSRFVGPDLERGAHRATRDPSMDAPYGAFTAALNDLVRRRIGFETDDDYQILSFDVNRAWKWERDDKRVGYPHVAEDLRKALLANPHLQVLMANGLYDLATPFFAAEYTADHLELDDQLRDNLTLTWYPAGHMMYLHPESLSQLHADLERFYE